MGRFILLVLASIGPGLLWLWYFYRQDRVEPEPVKLVLKVFVVGLLLVIPAGMIEQFWQVSINNALRTNSWIDYLVVAFLVVAVVEEGLKSFFLWWLMGKNPELDEPIDGVIYGVTIGLGFASLENLLWAGVYGFGVAALRALVTTLAHASFSGWMGYYLANYKLAHQKKTILLWYGFLVAFLTHGFYDFLLFLRNSFASLVAFLVVAVSLFLLYRVIHIQQAEARARIN